MTRQSSSSDQDSTPVSNRLESAIAAAVDAGHLRADPAQQPAIDALDGILDALHAPKLSNKKSALGWLFGKQARVSDDSLRGLYLWGGCRPRKDHVDGSFF